jgi:F-type H+-transporting ATPase subunit gamma
MYCVGKKASDFFRKSDFEIVREERDAMSSFDFTLAASLGDEVIRAYLAGELDEVHVCYGEFQSMAKQIPTTLDLLPMTSHEVEEGGEKAGSGDYIYEPSVEGLLAELLPRFIKVQVYRGLLDTSCSEHAARMAAMDNASKACDDLTESLTLLYNKTRQAAITGDLMDIVGGAEALKG